MEGSWGRDIGVVTLRSLLKAERQVLKKKILRAIGSKQLVIWVTNLNKVKHINILLGESMLLKHAINV